MITHVKGNGDHNSRCCFAALVTIVVTSNQADGARFG